MPDMTATHLVILILSVIAVLYLAMILTFTTGLRRLKKTPPAKKPFTTRVTLVIPARNEEDTIENCLKNITGQDYPLSLLEVLVVDDQSTDDTAGTVLQFIRVLPGFPLRLLRIEPGKTGRGSKKSAIGLAVAGASGELIITTDADTLHGKAWISSIVGYYEAFHPVMILGPVAFHLESSLLKRFQSLEFVGLMAATAGACGVSFPVMCNGANLAYQRRAFLEAGGYGRDVKFPSGDDLFLMSRFRERYGSRSVHFLLSGEAVVRTEARSSLADFFHQRIRWISKNKQYRDPRVISVAILTYLFNLAILAGFLWGIFDRWILAAGTILLLAKMIFEFPAVFFMAAFFRKKRLLKWFPAVQILNIPYVVFLGVLGLFLPYEWKGRKFR